MASTKIGTINNYTGFSVIENFIICIGDDGPGGDVDRVASGIETVIGIDDEIESAAGERALVDGDGDLKVTPTSNSLGLGRSTSITLSVEFDSAFYGTKISTVDVNPCFAVIEVFIIGISNSGARIDGDGVAD